MNRPLITVFTPAYNRAGTLERTYRSLCAQTCSDFEWLVIDDGSTDNTRELVESWIAEARIPIRYIRQENQGMHGAHNTAYRNITTELNVCIDSDDAMPADAIDKIAAFWKQHEADSDRYAGIVGLDTDMNTGKLIGTKFDRDTTTLQGFYARGGKGDKKLVYRTDVICSYPEYPLFEGERYVGLAYKYMLIDRDYELLTLNESLADVEYQPDGSSVNMYRQYWRNPRGFAFFRRTEMICSPNLKRRFIVCAHYVSSCIISRDKRWLADSPRKMLTLVAAPAGALLYLMIRRAVKKDKKLKI